MIPVLWVYFLLCTDAAREAENADDAADNGKPGKKQVKDSSIDKKAAFCLK